MFMIIVGIVLVVVLAAAAAYDRRRKRRGRPVWSGPPTHIGPRDDDDISPS